MAHLNDDSFLSREQRLQLEHALSEKRKDEELSAMGTAQGHNNVQPSAKTKPSVLDIDPWESSAHLFLRRPSLEKGPPGRRASYEDKKAGAVAGLQLNKGRDNDGKPRRKSKGEKAWEPGLVPGETSHFLDEKDPNYNSEEDNECVYKAGGAGPGVGEVESEEDLAAFKKSVDTIMAEYLSSGDSSEFSSSIQGLNRPFLHHIIVKRAVATAMDHRPKEKEMVSQLLSSLVPSILTHDQVTQGFEDLLGQMDDLILDVPDVITQAALFIARAVVDDLVAPSFVATCISKSDRGSAALESLTYCGRLLSARHSTERLLRCWGAGAGRDIDATKESIKGMLKEFVASADAGEAARCLAQLQVPFFHHEVVKQALVLTIEEPAVAEKLASLLGSLSKTGQLSPVQIQTGFARVRERLEDLKLDVPQAEQRFVECEQKAREVGWLV